jgi:hypothetical protein
MIKTRPTLFCMMTLLCFGLSDAWAQERLEMEGTAITGNQELPRILYIVPWQSAKPAKIDTPQVISILERPIQSLNRSEFLRQNNYYHVLFNRPSVLYGSAVTNQ